MFATTTGAAKERELLERLRCPIVFVEEAALVGEVTRTSDSEVLRKEC